jgi:hypothetical protein
VNPDLLPGPLPSTFAAAAPVISVAFKLDLEGLASNGANTKVMFLRCNLEPSAQTLALFRIKYAEVAALKNVSQCKTSLLNSVLEPSSHQVNIGGEHKNI